VPCLARYAGLAHPAIGREPARGEGRVLELGDAHREVEAFLDDVDAAIGQTERKTHLWILRGECRDARRDVLVAERSGQRDAQHALRLDSSRGHRGVRLVDLREQARAGFVIARAFVGQMQAAGGAIDEPYSQPCFQGGELAADQGRRQPELAGGA
jgi:hypothetical protein